MACILYLAANDQGEFAKLVICIGVSNMGGFGRHSIAHAHDRGKYQANDTSVPGSQASIEDRSCCWGHNELHVFAIKLKGSCGSCKMVAGEAVRSFIGSHRVGHSQLHMRLSRGQVA